MVLRARRTINLLKGFPSPSLLPKEALSNAAQAVLTEETIATPALQYGADEGFEPLREAVAQWNASFYNSDSDKDNIAISGGASQNVACLLQVFTDPLYTQNIWISSPAYMLIFRIFDDSGFASKLQAVPEIEGGLDVVWLEEQLEACEARLAKDSNRDKSIKSPRPWSKHYRHVIYCVPTFSNPSSRSMTPERREALVRCARKYDALIIADDVYDQLQWKVGPETAFSPMKRSTYPRLIDIDATLDGGFLREGSDGFGNAMSNGSFSKIIAPGVRCGFTEGSPKFAYGMSQAGSSRSGGCPSQLTSTFILKLLTSGWLDQHVFGTLQREYSERYQIMAKTIAQSLVPLGCSIVEPEGINGGFFIWLKLPPGVDADMLTKVCETNENLILASGTQFEVPAINRQGHQDHVRLCFAWEDKSMLIEGIMRLAKGVEALQVK